MNVNFYLMRPDAEVSAVRLVVTHHGRAYKKGAGVSVRTCTWKRPKGGVQTSTDPKAAALLKRIRLDLEARLSSASTDEEVREAIADAVGKRRGDAAEGEETGGRPSFWEFFKEYCFRPRPNSKNYTLVYRKVLEMMGDGDGWEDINGAWELRLNRAMDGKGYSVNYKGAIIRVVKSAMNEAHTLRYHSNTDYMHFRKPQEQSDSIALTQEEVDALWNADGLPSMEAKARDLFIIGVYTAARFSDYSRLSLADVRDGMVRFVQHKTSASVVIPASPRLLAAMERNGGSAPRLSQQKFNEAIKSVCRRIGMTQAVYVTRSKGARHVTERTERWKMVSSHTARRTGATLLYMSGVPLRQCMMITGHTTEANFMRYIRVTKEENAELLADNPFFSRG